MRQSLLGPEIPLGRLHRGVTQLLDLFKVPTGLPHSFRLLNQLLTQTERVMQVNDTYAVTLKIEDAAGDRLAVGQS